MMLPRYSGTFVRCVKCGEHTLAHTTYSANVISAHGAPRVVRDEHLKRTCRNCGYEWAEACADSVKTGEQ